MKAQQLKNAILQLAIQGKLVPQNPDDEPASVLLEKIRAEKEQLIREGKIKKSKKTTDSRPYQHETPPFEIPESWAWVRLGDIGQTNIGLTYKPSDIYHNGTIVLRSGNIQNGKINTDVDLVKVNLQIPDSKKCYKNDILICARNGSKKLVGKAAIIEQDGFSFGAFMAIFRTSFYKYIYYYLSSPYFRSDFDGIGTTTINQLTQENLNNRLVPLPPLAEQHRIVQKLEEILPLVEHYGEKEEKLTALHQSFPEQLKKSILQAAIQGKLTEQLETDEPATELLKRIQAEKVRLIAEKKIKKPKAQSEIFIRDNLPFEKIGDTERCIADEVPFELPKNWCWVRLENIILSNIGGGTPAKNISKYWNGDIPWASVKDLSKDHIYIDTTNEFITQEGLDNSSSNLITKGNIILCTRMGIGKIAINEIDLAINQDLRGIILPNEIDKLYFIHFFKTLNIQGQGLTVKGLPIDELNNILFPLPPLSEQHRIVEKIETLFSSIENLK